MGKFAILSIMRGFVKDYKAYTKEVDSINASTRYNDEGKNELITELEDKYKPIFFRIADRMEVELDSAINQVKNMDGKATASKLANAGYQIGLANAVKIIETGSVQTVEDMQHLVNVYKDDRSALNLLSHAVKKLPSRDLSIKLGMLIPEDTREKNIELLTKFRATFSNTIRSAALRRMAHGFTMGELAEGQILNFDNMFEENCRLKEDYNGSVSASIPPASSSNM